MKKRLYRNKEEGVFMGVCSGLGDYFNIDPVFIRIAWLLTFVIYGVGALAYVVSAVLIPDLNPNK